MATIDVRIIDERDGGSETVAKGKLKERKQVTLYMEPALIKKLKITAINRDMEMSQLAEQAIRKELGRNG